MAGVEGLEPPTYGFGDHRSGQLSYTPLAHRGCDCRILQNLGKIVTCTTPFQGIVNLLYNRVMNKLVLTRPILIMLYGYPGAGKTFFARQLCEEIGAAHVYDDRIRFELFEQPRYDRQETELINHLMSYMAEEFLSAGVAVVYDTNAMRTSQRQRLRELARKHKAESMLLWLQIDLESAFTRVVKRDRRKTDDKYTSPMDRTTFEAVVGQMQNPGVNEDQIVISGKHTFHTQKTAILKRLYDLGLLSSEAAHSKVVKPGLVNLVPTPSAGRVDISRRNIIIR